MIRAIVSDFGGVLTNPLTEPFSVWYARSGVTLEQLGAAMARAAEEADGEHPLFALEKGHISEDEFVARLEAHLDGVTFAGFRETYFEHLHPNEPMIDYLRELRSRGYRMAMLTNNVREWEPLWRAKLPVDEIFEVVVDSGFVGMRKPEREIYELTLSRLGEGLSFEDCLFVDDLDVNCAAARELGMTAVLFEDAEQAIAEIEAALSAQKNETRTSRLRSAPAVALTPQRLRGEPYILVASLFAIRPRLCDLLDHARPGSVKGRPRASPHFPGNRVSRVIPGARARASRSCGSA